MIENIAVLREHHTALISPRAFLLNTSVNISVPQIKNLSFLQLREVQWNTGE